MQGLFLFIIIGGGMALLIAMILFASQNYSLNGIKSKTVGNGQHGTARWANAKEISKAYRQIPYQPQKWRQGRCLPQYQGFVIGSNGSKRNIKALVDDGDVHCLMIGAAGIGKTAFFLYPNLEYCCAAGMSFITTDTKGDLYRNYGTIAEKYYGYEVLVIDLRNPTRSHGFNMLHLVNKYMDKYKEDHKLAHKSKAEKYAKIIAKTIIFTGEQDAASYGQNAFFYDAAEGLLTAVILLVSEFCDDPKRHIISVFKLIQELLTPSGVKGKNQFQLLLEKLPEDHKARWFAGAALNTADQAMQSVLSTALSRLNEFLDSELEQILCFDTVIDAEKFCNSKSAIFICMPEEDATKHFLVSLIIQQLYREILSVADETDGKLRNKIMMFLDEIGTIPKIKNIEMMFSASRSRGCSIIAIIQSFLQLEQNYGKEGAGIIIDNCQDCISGGFAPLSEGAKIISDAIGSRTVLSGSISKGKNDPSQSLNMIDRPVIYADELKVLRKGNFIVNKTGMYPMMTEFRLFKDWGITFEEPYRINENANRVVFYACKDEVEQRIAMDYPRSQKRESEDAKEVQLNQLEEYLKKHKKEVRTE